MFFKLDFPWMIAFFNFFRSYPSSIKSPIWSKIELKCSSVSTICCSRTGQSDSTVPYSVKNVIWNTSNELISAAFRLH
jgi:hypothetical protein